MDKAKGSSGVTETRSYWRHADGVIRTCRCPRAKCLLGKVFRPPSGHVMTSRIVSSGTTAIGELGFEQVHSTHRRMVSQSTGCRDSPVDACEGTSRAFEDTDGLPGLLDTDHPRGQLDVRLVRHKASWINPPCMQEEPLRDLCPQRATVQSSRKHLVVDTPSPLGLPPLPHRDSLAETPLSEDSTDAICSSSAHGTEGKNGDFSSPAPEEQEVHCQHGSLLKNPKTVATSLSPRGDGAHSESLRLTASADDGAAGSSRRSHSWNFIPPETFTLPLDVEKEDVHFYAADMIIAVMENMKCSLLSRQRPESWATEEASRSRGNDQTDAEVTFYSHAKQEPGSSASLDRGHEELEGSNEIMEGCRRFYNFLKSVTCKSDFSPAGLLARKLLHEFWKCQMLSEVSHHRLPGSVTAASSGVGSEKHAGEDFDSSVEATQEIMLKSRAPGTEDWVPPGCQIILTVHPPVKRDIAVVAQNFFCAGCGTPIQPKSCIPARILRMWDFRKYQVSNFSKWLLDSIWHQPVFNLLGGHHSLYEKAKELDRVKDIQEQLFHIKKLLKTCRFANSVLKEFEQVPSHLTDECHLFSMEDLLRTKKGLLAPLFKDILRASLAHVDSCELCQGKGFICELCRSTAVIFPFQTTTCARCSGCRACFHKECFQSSRCPRCARIEARRQHLESLPSAAP
ncbi:protein associated with UVRAG as autophagy enhancer isoform X3 [Meriones unguiculatus]|uniref:protein associated with UVRAG as autophagy enhancer isoform X3 n=1 Tax=Meriones unguiculatus TaxID=10047 RepID=UPI00293E0B33|nr:protein associated with UVRAG as autophagy enhancer isoform X3 [Meriones unguiculatus]